MSTYVMSDIHGCYDEMMKMLDKIEFSSEDMLIVAGDYIDRGTQSFEMLEWVEEHPENVVLLKGNHEEEFSYCIELMESMYKKHKVNLENEESTKYVYELIKEIATGNGLAPFDYYGTIGRLITENGVVMAQFQRWQKCIKDMPYVYEVEIKGRKHIIVHAGYISEITGDEMDDCFDTMFIRKIGMYSFGG